MSTEKVRIGFIGVGQIGKQHVEAYSKLPHAELVALADLNEAEGRRVADLYGIPHVYTDFRKLLERDDIDAVDVCLHNNFHMPITVAALEAGKHVYCEKPMAGSYVDAETMLKTARATGKLLGATIVGQQATELVHFAMAVIHYGGSVEDLTRFVFNLPSLSALYRQAAYAVQDRINAGSTA